MVYGAEIFAIKFIMEDNMFEKITLLATAGGDR